MAKELCLKLKAIINKNNKQINLSLPKKQVSDKLIKDIETKKYFKIKYEDIFD